MTLHFIVEIETISNTGLDNWLELFEYKSPERCLHDRRRNIKVLDFQVMVF